ACLGLYPAIAALFVTAKILPLDMEGRYQVINYVFFGFWLLYTIYAYFIKSSYRINKHAILVAGIFGLAIPIINGSVTGLWFWKSLGMGYSDSFFVDISWLVLSLITLWAAYVAKPVNKEVSPLEIPEERTEVFKKDTIISKPVLNINPKAR
ncbi:MAG: hypothetical protein AAGF85_19460, partial [Bacteroidota bacterium]